MLSFLGMKYVIVRCVHNVFFAVKRSSAVEHSIDFNLVLNCIALCGVQMGRLVFVPSKVDPILSKFTLTSNRDISTTLYVTIIHCTMLERWDSQLLNEVLWIFVAWIIAELLRFEGSVSFYEMGQLLVSRTKDTRIFISMNVSWYQSAEEVFEGSGGVWIAPLMDSTRGIFPGTSQKGPCWS